MVMIAQFQNLRLFTLNEYKRKTVDTNIILRETHWQGLFTLNRDKKKTVDTIIVLRETHWQGMKKLKYRQGLINYSY